MSPTNSLAQPGGHFGAAAEASRSERNFRRAWAIGALAAAVIAGGVGLSSRAADEAADTTRARAAAPPHDTNPVGPDALPEPADNLEAFLAPYNSRTGAGTVEGAVIDQLRDLGYEASRAQINELRTATLRHNGWTEGEARQLPVRQGVRLLDAGAIKKILGR